MTKKELIQKLWNFHDDARIIVSAEGDAFDIYDVSPEWKGDDDLRKVEDRMLGVIKLEI